MEREQAIEQGLDQIREALGTAYDAGMDSAPVQEPDSTPYGEADLSAAGEEAAANQKAVDEEILEAAKADLQGQISDLRLELSQKDSDALEEAIAEKLEALGKELRERTVKAPAPEVPSEKSEQAESAEPRPDAQGSQVANGSDINSPSQI